MGSYQAPPGTEDILPDNISIWQFMERTAAELFSLYGFVEIRTPVFEFTELFSKGIGEQTEVVQKEMYTFEDKGGRSLTLRPEGTAGIIRALSVSALQGNNPRVFHIGPMFRGERPAAGRKRQFHQIGAENISPPSPELDAECIVMLAHFLKKIGVDNVALKLNTRGDADDRATAGRKLREILSPQKSLLCEDCTTRFDRNVWRILDCKNPQCGTLLAELPALDGLFSEKSRAYLARVLEILLSQGIPFEKDWRLVRGLDYYAHTVFEITHPGLGAQNAIAGGGRYEILAPGAKKTVCGVGFACGLERLIIAAAPEEHKKTKMEKIAPVFIVSIGKDAMRLNFSLAQKLRQNAIPTVADFEERSMKSAMRAAGKSGAKITLIRGENEIKAKTIIIKNMDDGSQNEITENSAIEHLKRNLNSRAKQNPNS